MADEETITTSAAERRLGGQLMFMGIVLGAMFIAVLGLGFLYNQAVLAPNSTVATLTTENKALEAKIETSKTDIAKLQKDVETLTREKAEIQKQLDAKSGKKPAAPKPVDPFTR